MFNTVCSHIYTSTQHLKIYENISQHTIIFVTMLANVKDISSSKQLSILFLFCCDDCLKPCALNKYSLYIGKDVLLSFILNVFM